MTNNQSYSIGQNARYCAKRILSQTGARYYLPAVLKMLTTALFPFVSAFFPSTLVTLLTEGAGIGTIVLSVLGFVLLLGTLTLVSSLGATYRDRALLQFRLGDTALFQKIFTFSYAYLESKQTAIDQEEARKAHYSGTREGIEKTIQCPVDIAGALTSILLYASVTAALHPLLVFVLLGCSCIQAVAISKNMPYQKKTLETIHKKETDFTLASGQCTDIKAAKDIRSYQMARWFHGKNQSYCSQLTEINYSLHKRKFGIQAIGRAAVFLRDILCYGYLIRRMTLGMDLGSFTLYLSIFSGFTGYFEVIVQRYWAMADTNPTISAFRNFMDEPSHQILEGSRPLPPGPHSFTFQDVSFTYPDAEEPVLHHLDLTIHQGEKLALVGLNGAGKTTLVKLLCGLYRPTSGRILMDGIDIQEFRGEDYYRAVGAVFQDDFSLAFPLTENVTCLPDGEENEEKLWKCLSLAGLAQKIRSFPNTVHTPLYQNIDPQGIVLSGGEMQKLMLARALYKDADTLVLDEPTAALDPLAEADMYARYHEMSQNKTSIFISHRLSSTRFCDRIVLLSEGRIVEEGSHDSLIRLGGIYAELFRTQASYYQKEAPAL